MPTPKVGYVHSDSAPIFMQFKKGMMTRVYSPHSILINGPPCHTGDPCSRQRSASLEDNDNDKLSESTSNVLLLFSERPVDSSAEPEETYSEDDDDDAKNESDQAGSNG